MKKNSLATTIAYVAVFTALVIVLAFVSIPIGSAGVPIVLQNAALILAGLILGSKRGGYVGLLFLFLGLALPVLAGGGTTLRACLLYTSPSPRDQRGSRMPSSA